MTDLKHKTLIPQINKIPPFSCSHQIIRIDIPKLLHENPTVECHQVTVSHNRYELKCKVELLKYPNTSCNPGEWSSHNIKHMFQIDVHHSLQIVHHEQEDYRVCGTEQHHEPVFNSEVHVVLAHAGTGGHDNLIVNVTVFVFMDNSGLTVAAVLVNQVVNEEGEEYHHEGDGTVEPAVN